MPLRNGSINLQSLSSGRFSGIGRELENDFFGLEPGDLKCFFSLKTIKEKTKQFKTVVLDDQGTIHKDSVKGVFNLIRFVGQKESN